MSKFSLTYQGKLVALNGRLSRSSARSSSSESGGRIWCVYSKTDDDAYDTDQIWCAYSDDDGVTWTEEQITTATPGYYQYEPSIAIDSSDDIHLVWNSYDDNGYLNYILNIRYRKRVSGVWQSIIEITARDDYDQSDPAIAVDSSDDAHIVWNGQGQPGFPAGEYVVVYHRLSDSLQEVVSITFQHTTSRFPTIAIDSGDNIHVAYSGVWGPSPANNEIRYRKRTSSWQTTEDITDKGYPNRQTGISIAIDTSGYVNVAWVGKGWGVNTGYGNIQYSRRESASSDWANNEESITDITYTQLAPAIALDISGIVSIVWSGLGHGDNLTVNNIQLRQRIASVWQSQISITDSQGINLNPNLPWSIIRVPSAYAILWQMYLAARSQALFIG